MFPKGVAMRKLVTAVAICTALWSVSGLAPVASASACPSVDGAGHVSPTPSPGDDLSGCTLTGAILEGVNLTGVNLTDAVLTASDLRGANLSGANLSSADLTVADLTGANLLGANLTVATFTSANLTSATLWGADATAANFQSANLTSANFTDAVLTAANLATANLTGANLTTANLDATEFALAFISCSDSGVLGAGISGTPADLPVGWSMVSGTLTVPMSPCPRASILMWQQAIGRASASTSCPAGYSGSWDTWPNNHTGGYVCNRFVPEYGN